CTLIQPLLDAGRAVFVGVDGARRLVPRRYVDTWRSAQAGDDAAIDVLARGRLEWCGPSTASELGELLGVGRAPAEEALGRLEREGFVLRGEFGVGAPERQYCERRLLARMHRMTIGRERRSIEPVSPAVLLEFFTRFQGVHPEHRQRGLEGTLRAITQLSHFPAPAADWEASILPARVADYDPSHLDILTASGRVAWHVPARGARRFGRSSPLVLAPRDELTVPIDAAQLPELSSPALRVIRRLQSGGAAFPSELTAGMSLLPSQLEALLAELIGSGVASTDSFSGVRALLGSKGAAARSRGRRLAPRRPGSAPRSLMQAGRLGLTPAFRPRRDEDERNEVEAREVELPEYARRDRKS